jgi:plasmid stability protein
MILDGVSRVNVRFRERGSGRLEMRRHAGQRRSYWCQKNARRNHFRCHNGTVNLTIKNIPDEVHKTLKRVAAARGRSLNSEVIRLLQEGAEQENRREHIRTTWDDFLKFRASMPKLRKGTITKLIREDRDSH